jgi:hypothetical protein
MKFGILHMTILLFICLNFQFGYSKDSLDIELEELAELDDLDAMFEQAVWEEIQEVTTLYFEVDKITAVAGVRGAEAEDEALHHLYYRKSMKGISIQEYKVAYGKLKNTRDDLFSKNPNHPKLSRMDVLLSNLRQKIKNS